MATFGKEYEVSVPFEQIEQLELLDLVSHGDVKKWFEDTDDVYDVTVKTQLDDDDDWCTYHFTVEGCRYEDGKQVQKKFGVKIRYNPHNHGNYDRYMSEFWEYVHEYCGSDSDEEDSDEEESEEEPDYLVEAHKQGFADGIVGNIIKKKWAERKIQKFIMKRYGWISDKPCPLPSDYVRGHYN